MNIRARNQRDARIRREAYNEMWKAFGMWLSKRTGHDMPSHNEHGLFWEQAEKALSGRNAADARLIAAAPDLLKALRDLLDMVTDNRTHGPEVDAACAAIQKAERA